MSFEANSEEQDNKKTFLYARIMLWVSIPLFILSVFFTATQLSQQVSTLNQINRIQSEYAFKSIYTQLQAAFKNEETYASPETLPKILNRVKSVYDLTDINCFNVLENKPLLSGPQSSWTQSDIRTIEEILADPQKNSPYTIRLDKDLSQLMAYMLFHGYERESLYVLKVVYPLTDIKTAFASSRGNLITTFLIIILTGLIISQGLARAILRPIKILGAAAEEIIKGELGKHIKIKTGDEIETLAHTFNKMSDALAEMKKRAQDSNPLTGLQGNSGIYDEIERRISEGQKFVLFHTDLDRFKVFNDRFGLALGDKAIKKTAEFIKKAIKEKGATGDFIGHQGGDDFVIITQPQKAKELGEYICEGFKPEVVAHLYSKEDYERGYIMTLDRRRQTETGETVMVAFPLLTISLAGISNSKKLFANYSDCMSRVVPVKKEVKKIIDSCCIIQE